jgi:glucose-6-phosphate isomerase
VNEHVIDLSTGVISGEGIIETVRTVGDLSHLFLEGSRLSPSAKAQEIYRTYATPAIDESSPELLYSTTILQPGRVGQEHFMTRGHFHVKPERGETCVTLHGEGVLMLLDREGNRQEIAMHPGAAIHIDGKWAHRVVNTGSAPLVFYVAWLADCGHDYASIESLPLGSWSISSP